MTSYYDADFLLLCSVHVYKLASEGLMLLTLPSLSIQYLDLISRPARDSSQTALRETVGRLGSAKRSQIAEGGASK